MENWRASGFFLMEIVKYVNRLLILLSPASVSSEVGMLLLISAFPCCLSVWEFHKTQEPLLRKKTSNSKFLRG
jgi:hypothetical protein